MASAVIDANIAVTGVTKNTNGTIKVTYKVKVKDAGKKGISIGYEWPSNYRLSDSSFTTVANTVGTHTITLPKPKVNAIGTQNVVAKLSGRYTESKHLKSVFNYPDKKEVTYHEVSKLEAGAEYFVVVGLGAAIEYYFKKSKIGFVLGKAYLGFITYYGLTSVGVIEDFPPAVVGQYLKVTTWYSSQGFHVKTEIWANKSSFDKKAKAIYVGTAVSKW